MCVHKCSRVNSDLCRAPFVVALLCPGMQGGGVLEGGLMGYYGEGEGFELHSHRLMSLLTPPERYFGFFCALAREQLGAETPMHEAPDRWHRRIGHAGKTLIVQTQTNGETLRRKHSHRNSGVTDFSFFFFLFPCWC